MGSLAPLLLSLLLACAPKALVPELSAPSTGPAWPPPPDPPQVAWVGALELPGAGLVQPLDVACAPGRLAIADPGAGRVVVVDLSSRRVRALSPAGGLVAPVGVLLDSRGDLLVVDSARAGIYRSEAARERPKALILGEPLVRPTAVIEDGQGYLVVDAGLHTLHRLSRDGEVLGSVGSRGLPGQGFNFPVDGARARDGSILVADSLNATLQRVSDGAIEPFLAPEAPGSVLIRPKGVIVDERGWVHVVDAGMQHVQVYDDQATLLGRYGQPGPQEGGLALPAGACALGELVFVADSVNQRVSIFRILESAP